jgi:hypothetical protein
VDALGAAAKYGHPAILEVPIAHGAIADEGPLCFALVGYEIEEKPGVSKHVLNADGCRSETDCIERIPGRARIRHYAASAKPGCS